MIFNISWPEISLIFLIFVLIFAIGQYGRNTSLGYTGTVLVCLLATPLVGFALVYFLKANRKKI